MHELFKNRSLAFLVIIGCAFFVFAPINQVKASSYKDTIQTEGNLLYYWPMDEAYGATSLSAAVGGTVINLTGATAGATGADGVGTAVSFNGINNFGVTAAKLNLTAYNKIVVEALFYVNYYNDTYKQAWEFNADTLSTTTGALFAYEYSQGTTDKSSLLVRGNNSNNDALFNRPSAGFWHHIAAVYDKGQAVNEVDFYLDGVLQSASHRDTADNTNNFGNNFLYIMSRAGNSFYGSGKMQHLAIYSNLSSSTINYHASLLGLTAGTLTKVSQTSNSISLSWTGATFGESPIAAQLQRTPHGTSTWSNIAGATASPFTDSGFDTLRNYDYRVVYTDATSSVVYSDTAMFIANKTYPPYTADARTAIVAPYDTAASGAANLGGATSVRDVLTAGHLYRIRQNGTITKARLYTGNKTNLTAFYITVYRSTGGYYDLVGKSDNLVSQLVAGDYATTTFATPITGVQEGDYYGYRIECSAACTNFYVRTGQTGVALIKIDGVDTPTHSNWLDASYTSYSGLVLPIELYMRSPQFVFTGDSIFDGATANISFLRTTEITDIPSTIENQFNSLTGYTYQNMSIGGETTSNIAARFTNDVINLHPRVAVIEGGVNDIAYGVITKATFLANWTAMLNATQANGITAMVVKILPWTNGSNANMQKRDDWNASLVALVAGYSNAIVVDASSYVGKFRAGGDANNLWDIQTMYNGDGVHFNKAGHFQIAQAIADALDSTAPTITSVTSASASGNYTAGQAINITVNFSEIASSTGNVIVTFNTVPARTCAFSVASANSGSCVYTVQSGDTSASLEVSSISGVIKDGVLNAMTNFTPASSLSVSKAMTINYVAPVSSGGSSHHPPVAPAPSAENPLGGFRVLINNGAEISTSSKVSLKLFAGFDTVRMLISNMQDFSGAVLEDYQFEKKWDICSGMLSSDFCLNGMHSVYAKFYTSRGLSTGVYHGEIDFRTAIAKEIKEQGPTPSSISVATTTAGAEPDESIDSSKDVPVLLFEAQQLISRTEGAVFSPAVQNIYDQITSFSTQVVSPLLKNLLTSFIGEGTPSTISLGAGERGGVVNSFQNAFGRLPETETDWQDVIKIANGRWPGQSSLPAEERARSNFKKVYLRNADMKDRYDNAAVTIMAYGLRPTQRNLSSERAAIKSFRYVYFRVPVTAREWDVVRAIAYSGAKR